MRLETCAIMTITAGAKQAVPRSTDLRLHHSKAGSVARLLSNAQRCRCSSSSVYLFALDAYSSPIPTASAMGLIERSGGWRLEHGGERPAAAGNLGAGSPNLRNVALVADEDCRRCASDLSKNERRKKSHATASRPLSLPFAKLGAG